MAYNQFKSETLSELELKAFLPQTLPVFKPTDLVLTILQEATNEALATEKAKSEFIINPVLKELHRQNMNRFSYFSGYKFDVDVKLQLKGYCDFILSATANSPIIKSPIFCLVEAKKAAIEEGFGQCGAEMYAAQLFNERHHNPQKIIYGCVTNAFSWAFLRLENNILSIDPNYIPLTFAEPHKVLSILQWILDEF
jgi:hypothetical protein